MMKRKGKTLTSRRIGLIELLSVELQSMLVFSLVSWLA